MPEPKRCSCCEKHTLRAEEEKKKLLNRLRRIEGQVRGLQAMVESNAYCNDILTQSAAVNAAVACVNKQRSAIIRSQNAGALARKSQKYSRNK